MLHNYNQQTTGILLNHTNNLNKKEMNYYTQNVTPDLARTLLESNTVNRKLSQRNISSLAKQIQMGNFKETGDTIKISKTGRLLDGQHRLKAIILANQAVDLSFCAGLDDNIFDVLDTGKSRSAADVLSVTGVKNPGDLSSAARHLMSIKSGKQSKSIFFSNKQILDFIESTPELVECVRLIHSDNKKFKVIPTAGMAALYFVFKELHHEQAEDFMDKYYTPVDLKADSPVFTLRDIFLRDSIAKKKMSIRDKMALVVLAWNAMRKNKPMKRRELNSEEFPKAV